MARPSLQRVAIGFSVIASTPAAAISITCCGCNPLGVANAKRLAILPDVPTMHEAGVPNFQAGSWFGFFAPTGTAQPVIGRLNAEFTKILSSPVERDRVAAGGSADITIGTPEQLGDLVKSEIAKWSAVIRDANIRVE